MTATVKDRRVGVARGERPTQIGRKACRAADIFAREAAHSARIQIGAAGLTLLSSGAETGDNRAELPATVEGAPIEVASKVKYVLDALNQMPGEQVALEVATPSSPGAIKPVGRDDYLVVVMPLHAPGNAPSPSTTTTRAATGAEASSISAQTVPATTAA